MIDEGRRGSGPTYFVTVALWYNISHMFSQSPNPTSGQRQRQRHIQRQSQRQSQRKSQRKRQMIDNVNRVVVQIYFLSKIKINFI